MTLFIALLRRAGTLTDSATVRNQVDTEHMHVFIINIVSGFSASIIAAFVFFHREHFNVSAHIKGGILHMIAHYFTRIHHFTHKIDWCLL